MSIPIPILYIKLRLARVAHRRVYASMTSYPSRSLVSSVVVIANSLAALRERPPSLPQMSYIGAGQARTVACRDGARVPR